MYTTDLKPAEYNPRTISEQKLAALKKSLQEFGDLGGIVYNIRTGNLVGGHQRIASLDQNWPITKKPYKDETGTVATGYIETSFGRFSYREVDWPEEKEKLANISANKQGGEFDKEKLAELFDDLKLYNLDLSLTGYTQQEMDKMFVKHDPPEVKNWEMDDIYEPFWIVVRGPLPEMHKVVQAIHASTAENLTVEVSQ